MKKQKQFMVITVVILLALATLFILRKGGKETNNISNSTGTVFTSIKDALSKDVSLICEFNDETGASTKSYIKNGAVRVSSQSNDIIIKDKKMYMWDIKTKQGFVYTIPDEENSNVAMMTSEVNQSESYLSMIDKYKDSCKVSTVSDSYFETPIDIEFQDMSKLLEDLQKQMPQNPQL